MEMLKIGLFVCFARMIDVSMGTMRMKAIMRGDKLQASMIAFIEVVVYSLAASQVFKYIDNPVVLILYALGYAAGNYIGIILDDKISKGTNMVMVIANHDGWKLADSLREKGYGVTTTKSYGLGGSQKVQLTVVIDKNRFKELNEIVYKYDEKAYIVNLDVKNVNEYASIVRK